MRISVRMSQCRIIDSKRVAEYQTRSANGTKSSKSFLCVVEVLQVNTGLETYISKIVHNENKFNTRKCISEQNTWSGFDVKTDQWRN